MVHGFEVSEDDATENFFPEWFKRLYWTGHPVLLPQNNTHTVGITWRGDPGATNYPIAYMSAFEAGVPLATYLTDQALLYQRKMQIMAHSLGNVVVNSALSRPESQSAVNQSAISTYVMNEPALPAEAFDADYQPDPAESAEFGQHAIDFGWSNDPAQKPIDQLWQTQWDQMTVPQRQQWVSTLSSDGYVTSPQPVYTLRWAQQRPAGGVPDSAPFNSSPQRGPWRGFFAGNLSKTHMVNTYNAGDGTLIEPWGILQLWQEPFVGFLGFSKDDQSVQFWANLLSTDGSQESAWGQPPCSTVGACQHSNIIRQWAELSYWFPSRSEAAGLRPLRGIQSIDFSMYAPPPSSTNFGLLAFSAGTHSYLKKSPYPNVFPAWQQIRSVLK
jgi:hypothetical protein